MQYGEKDAQDVLVENLLRVFHLRRGVRCDRHVIQFRQRVVIQGISVFVTVYESVLALPAHRTR